MEYQEILDKIKPELEKIQEYFKSQIMEIRAGRISFALVEEIKVDCFGSVLPLKQLGAISGSGKEIIVQLWDKSYVEGVVRAIEQRKLGLGLRVEGNTIYLSAFSLTEESKRNLLRVLNQKKEEISQSIRHLRDKAWKQIQEGYQKGEIREDDKYRGKDKLEELIQDHREKIEKMAEVKKKEIES
ncbi:MAG: ribosome-recycling factor [Patescibacteria group bacterium]|nr:ribosome-recycling factor [Patescibacteria group bacterium]